MLKFARAFINLIYPLSCQICKVKLDFQNQLNLCPECWQEIRKNISPCGKKLDCSPSLDFTWSACIYDGLLKECIHIFKYQRKLKLLKPLFILLSGFLKESCFDFGSFDLLVPMPLHSLKLRTREFNQSELLAKSLARKFGLKISHKNLIRVRNTLSQTQLKIKERFRNVEGAFRVRNPYQFQKKNLLLIDDILTTGATASEAATTLKMAGAKKVQLLTLARAN